MSRYRVRVDYDHDAECPCHSWDTLYELKTSKRGSSHYVSADEINSWPTEGESMVVVAYVLDVYEHSGIKYSLSGEGPPDYGGFDTARGGAILIVQERFLDEYNGLSAEQREANARAFLNEFNSWANGEVFGYEIEQLEQCDKGHWHGFEVLDSCYGYYGSPRDSGLTAAIRAALPDEASEEDIEISGEAGYVLDASDLFKEEVTT